MKINMAKFIEQDKIKCDECENIATHIQEPDPFAEEIHGDNTPCNLCEGCYEESCMEI